MSVEFYRGSPGKFDPRTLNRTTVSRWTGRIEHLCGRGEDEGEAEPDLGSWAPII